VLPGEQRQSGRGGRKQGSHGSNGSTEMVPIEGEAMKTKAAIIRDATDRLTLGKYCPNKSGTIQKLDAAFRTIWRYAWERCEMKMMDTVRGAVRIGVLKERERIRFSATYDTKRDVYTIPADVLNQTRKP
jgi:hypothetical protein